MQKYMFKFVDFKILNLSFAINSDFVAPKANESVELGSKLDIGYEKNGKDLKVYIKIGLNEKSVPFSLTIEGGGLFNFDTELSDDEINSIAKVNCAAIVFPYIRESVADITRRAGFPPLHLPPVNFVEIYKRMNEENKQTQNSE
jgi:preprotein translocase subunit SecB